MHGRPQCLRLNNRPSATRAFRAFSGISPVGLSRHRTPRTHVGSHPQPKTALMRAASSIIRLASSGRRTALPRAA